MNMLVKSSAVVAAAAVAAAAPELAKPAAAEPAAPSIAPAAISTEPTRIAKLWAERNAVREQARAAYRVVHQIERKAWRRAGPVNPAIAYSAANDRLGLERWGRCRTPYIDPDRIKAALRQINSDLAERSALRSRPVVISKREAKREARLNALLEISCQHDAKVEGFLNALGYDQANEKGEALVGEKNDIEARILKMRSATVGDLQIKFAIAPSWDDSCNHAGVDSIALDVRRLMDRPALAQAFVEA